MIPRAIESKIKSIYTQYPVTTILGPRQSGKSTLVRKLFPDKAYINLEAPDDRKIIADDPRSFLDSIESSGVIIDEVQRLPELLSYIQIYVDEKPRNGCFILTGSHQLDLQEAITQSLAGRTALFTLLPLSIEELIKSSNNYNNFSANNYMLKGFFPKLYTQEMDTYSYYKNYVNTYIERDVRKIVNVKDLNLFQNFLFLLAGRIGQIINYSNLSNELGVSNHTIKQWLSVLEASFITFKLQPYFENIGKRVIKSPKIYFTDPGLACYLLGIEKDIQLIRDPLKGNLFENLVILEIVKARYNSGKEHKLYFYRDSHNNEVDVIFKSANEIIPIEIKSSKTFNLNFLKGLKYLDSFLNNKISKGYIIYSGEEKHTIGKFKPINFIKTSKLIE